MRRNPHITVGVLEEYLTQARLALGQDEIEARDCVLLAQQALDDSRLYAAGVLFALADVLSQPAAEAGYYHTIAEEILTLVARDRPTRVL